MFDDEITVEMLYIKERRKTMLAKFERKSFFETPFTFEMVFGAAMTYVCITFILFNDIWKEIMQRPRYSYQHNIQLSRVSLTRWID